MEIKLDIPREIIRIKNSILNEINPYEKKYIWIKHEISAIRNFISIITRSSIIYNLNLFILFMNRVSKKKNIIVNL